MTCEPNQTSRDYKLKLENSSVGLELLNTCIQITIDEKLNELVKNDKLNSRTLDQKDNLTFDSMNKNTLSIYTNNLYYVIFKISLFFILICFYFLLSK